MVSSLIDCLKRLKIVFKDTTLVLLSKFKGLDAVPYLLSIAFGCIFSAYSVGKHFSFETYAWDLGAFSQSLWSTAFACKLLYNTPDFGHLHVHFDPILFLLVPVYRIFPFPESLLVIQAFALGFGAVPVYLIAKDVLKNKYFGLLFSCLFLMHPIVIGGTNFDFHPEAFMPVFMLFAFYYYCRKSWRNFFIFFVLALMTKETVAVITFFWGAYEAIKSILKIRDVKKKDFAISLAILGISTAWLITSLYITSYFLQFTPYAKLTSGYAQLTYWAEWGDSLPNIIVNILSHPLEAVNVIIYRFHELKAKFLFSLLLPLGFLPILYPLFFVNIPWFLATALSNNPHLFFLGGQHPVIYIPFTFVSAIYGVKLLHKLMTITFPIRLSRKIIQVRRTSIRLSTLCLSIFLIMVSVFSSFHFVPMFLQIPEITIHDRALAKIVSSIPADASIMTQNNIFPHFSNRLNAFPGYNEEIEFEYILVDTTHHMYRIYELPGYPQYVPIAQALPKLWSEGDYRLILAIDGIWLFRKGNLESAFTLNDVLNSLGKRGITAKFYNNTEFEGKPVFETVFFEIGPSKPHWGTDWRLNPPFLNISPQFSAVFEGYLYAPRSGYYIFKSESSGSLAFYIDNQLVVDTLTKSEIKSLEILMDEEGSRFWSPRNLGKGSYAVKISDEQSEVMKGNMSVKFQIVPGNNAFTGIHHVFNSPQDWSNKDLLSFYWYGKNSGSVFRVVIGTAPNGLGSRYVYTFIDNWYGWKKLNLPLKLFIAEFGKPDWSGVTDILIETVEEEKTIETWYLDYVTLIELEKSPKYLGVIFLEKGFHSIKILYVANEANPFISLKWMTPDNTSMEVIPEEFLYVDATDYK